MFRTPFFISLTLLAVLLAGAVSAKATPLNPAVFQSDGVLDLTSGNYTIDTTGGTGGMPVLKNGGGQVLYTGTNFD
jgi:hypothetical protein